MKRNIRFRAAMLVAGVMLTLGAARFAPAAAPASNADSAYTAPPLPQCNPMDWRDPKAMPLLPDPLTDARYKQHLAALHLAAAAPPPDGRPLTTVVVDRLDPDGAAVAHGILPGDVVISLDAQPMLDASQLTDARQEKGVTLGVMDPADRVREVKLPPGDAGIGLKTHWRAEAAWARSKSRDPRFDALLRAAAAALDSDPQLTQSALARAQRAGCDVKTAGYFPAALACLWAYRQCRFDDALEFGSLAAAQLPDDQKPFFNRLRLTAALASFKLQYALDLAGQMPAGLDPDTRSRLKLMVQSWGKVPHPVHPNPLKELGDCGFRDASARMVSLLSRADDLWDGTGAARALRDDGKLKLVAPGGQYRLLMFGPTGNNADAELEFTFDDSDRKQTPWARNFNFGLVDLRHKEVALLKCSQYDDGTLEVGRYTDTDYTLKLPISADRHWRVRAIILDQRCEVIVDGRRVFYGPVEVPEHGRKLGLLIQVVGVKATIRDYTWRVAGERKN